MSPRMDHSTTLQLAPIGQAGPYALYSGVLESNLSAIQLFGSSVDVVAEGLQTKIMFFKLFNLVR